MTALAIALTVGAASSWGLSLLTLMIWPAHPVLMGIFYAFFGLVAILMWAFWYFEHTDGPPDERGGAFLMALPLSFLWCLTSFGSVLW